jgi:glycosyltransferase involved in cell wall biosynthesis
MSPMTRREAFRVVLLAPLPPPWGGISRWTTLLREWGGRHGVVLDIVSTTPRWREGHDLRTLKRLTTGVAQGMRELGAFTIRVIFHRPAVIHLTTTGGMAVVRDLSVLLLSRALKIPVVYHFRMGRLSAIIARNGWEWRLLGAAMGLASLIVVVDPASADALRPCKPGKKVHFLPNAVDLGRLSSRPPDSAGVCRRVIYLGWILPTKGISELADAWNRAGRNGWELVLAGPGPKAYRQGVIGRLGQPSRFRILGEVSPPEAWALIREADIVVLPSYTEGFPNVILEAMAAEKAIIATPAGAIPEMLDFDGPEPCGLRIPPRSPAAIAEALNKLMDDAPLRRILGRRARIKVKTAYDVSEVFPRLLALWERAIRKYD